jgi:DNA-binding NtrC family response regulator
MVRNSIRGPPRGQGAYADWRIRPGLSGAERSYVEAILVVEDHSMLRTVICDALCGEGFAVHGAESVAEALALLDAHAFDAALVDVRMPGLDGFHLVEAMAERGIPTPVVMTSVAADPYSVRRCRELSVFAFHEKPFDFERLLADVRAACAFTG